VILGGGVAVCCLFTFVGASRGNLYDSTAFLLYFLRCVSLLWGVVAQEVGRSISDLARRFHLQPFRCYL